MTSAFPPPQALAKLWRMLCPYCRACSGTFFALPFSHDSHFTVQALEAARSCAATTLYASFCCSELSWPRCLLLGGQVASQSVQSCKWCAGVACQHCAALWCCRRATWQPRSSRSVPHGLFKSPKSPKSLFINQQACLAALDACIIKPHHWAHRVPHLPVSETGSWCAAAVYNLMSFNFFATQVFADLCPPLGLRVGLAAAQASVGAEAAALFPRTSHSYSSIHGDLPS